MDKTTTTGADYTILFNSASYLRAVSTGESGKECACCGRQTTGEYWVECAQDDLGWFPVGPECFKKLKKAGITVATSAQMGA